MSHALTNQTSYFISVLSTPLVLLLTAPLQAQMAEELLQGLRDRGWHDTALEYLDEASTDPSAKPEFIKKIAYELAVTQATLARMSTSEKKRRNLFRDSASNFQLFASKHPDSPLQLQALIAASNIFVEQSLYEIRKAEKLPKSAHNQAGTFFRAARQFLDQAYHPLHTVLELSKGKLMSLPAGAGLQKNAHALAERKRIEAKEAEAKFLLAKLGFEKSHTFASGSKEQQQTLKAAASAFAKIYEDYDDRLVGFFGRLYQGRCYQELEDEKQALRCYWDLIDQPAIANQDFRQLVTRAYLHRTECHIIDNDFGTAIEECKRWLSEARGPELNQPEWLALSYQLAKAYDLRAEQLTGDDSRRLRREARKLYREVAKVPGKYQRDARVKIASSSSSQSSTFIAKSFEDALTAGKETLDQMKALKIAAKIAEENNPASVGALKENVEVNRRLAIKHYQQAVALAHVETNHEQLFIARLQLSYLLWEDGRIAEAAIIADFLASRYPGNQLAPVAAKLAWLAYSREYNEARRQDTTMAAYEADRLASIAELIISQWPESDEAIAAMSQLMNDALHDDRIADAEAMLNRLPEETRFRAKLLLGSSIWTRYQRAIENNKAKSVEDLLPLKQRAIDLLSDGFESLSLQDSFTASDSIGGLFLAQALLVERQYKQALRVIETPHVGPLAVVEKETAAKDPKFALAVYKTALLALVSEQPMQSQKIRQFMNTLESTYGGDEKFDKQLTRIYLSLGPHLQRQINHLSANRQPAKAIAVTDVYKDLIQRITGRVDTTGNWNIQNWIAQANLHLGQGLEGVAAKQYFTQAEKAYRDILANAKRNPNFALSNKDLLSAKKQFGDCLQAQGKYGEAFEEYVEILRHKPNLLAMQQLTATTLQQWGSIEKKPEKLELAIHGTLQQPNKKNLVWGWLRLARLVDVQKRRTIEAAGESDAKVQKYNDFFFEARFQAAQSRFATAEFGTGKSRKKALNAAKQSTKAMLRLYPSLRETPWHAKYLELLKQIENSPSQD